MFELKPLSRNNLAGALEKAHHYRLLGESREAESICRDILAVKPDHQQAVMLLILAITDRFAEDLGGEVDEAKRLLPLIQDEYERAYYAGIICERKGKALFSRSSAESGPAVFNWLDKAMKWFERAEAMAGPDSDDARLRWNTCARLVNEYGHVRPAPGPPSGEYHW